MLLHTHDWRSVKGPGVVTWTPRGFHPPFAVVKRIGDTTVALRVVDT